MTARKNPALTGKLYGPRPFTTPDEEWRDVVGYEGIYLVSSVGRVYSIPRGVFFRPTPNQRGYLRTILAHRSSKSWDVRIHVLVAAAFIGPYPPGKEINHKNGIKTDNRAANLEYVIHQSNVQHAYDNGLRKKIGGEYAGKSLTWKAVRNIRQRWSKKKNRDGLLKRLMDEYKVSANAIWCVTSGKTWAEKRCA